VDEANRRVDFLILRRDSGNGKNPNLDAPPAVTGELAEIQKAIAASGSTPHSRRRATGSHASPETCSPSSVS
jgi:hypothetical protein